VTSGYCQVRQLINITGAHVTITDSIDRTSPKPTPEQQAAWDEAKAQYRAALSQSWEYHRKVWRIYADAMRKLMESDLWRFVVAEQRRKDRARISRMHSAYRRRNR